MRLCDAFFSMPWGLTLGVLLLIHFTDYYIAVLLLFLTLPFTLIPCICR